MHNRWRNKVFALMVQRESAATQVGSLQTVYVIDVDITLTNVHYL